MSSNLDRERRATRLLRWYPPQWRERYGEEFIDHLEQEFAERPDNFGRTINIAYKGLVTRLGDVGLSKDDVSSEGVTRAALGTSFALIALMVVIMLDLWSRAMAAWSGRRYHPIPVSGTTGVLTIAMGLLLLVLALVIVVVAICVARQIIYGRGRRLLGPSILAVISGGFLLYVARFLPRMIGQYIHPPHRILGISWSRPGQLIAALAQITWELTQRWVGAWNQGVFRAPTMQTVMNDSVPIAMFVFGVALALLIRRIDLPRFVARLLFSTVALLGVLSGVFFIAYIAWSAVGGPSNYEYFFPESNWLGIVYLILLGLVPALIVRSMLLARRYQPRRLRNHIEIVGSKSEWA